MKNSLNRKKCTFSGRDTKYSSDLMSLSIMPLYLYKKLFLQIVKYIMMKKLLFGFFALALSVTAQAQTTSGAKFGAVFSSLSGFEATGAGLDGTISSTIEDGRRGYFAGFFIGIPINEKLSFQPEFQYVQQGSNAEVLRVDYLQVPLALNIKLGDKLFANLGPQIGLRVWTSSDSGLIDTFDYSVFGTLGYDIKNSIFVEVRYALGLNDIASGGAIPLEVNEGSLTSPSFKNSYIYFGLGYRL